MIIKLAAIGIQLSAISSQPRAGIAKKEALITCISALKADS
ncbi:hypothetical protein [Dolichospermum sp. LEGE 00240]|nr:hypothetical protein [Dolichospermum sp. LEGE 00240]